MMVSTALRLTISSIVIKMGAKTVFFTASVQSNQRALPMPSHKTGGHSFE